MNRLQKKCFLGSAGIHVLLLLILFVGPAFLASKSKPDNLPVLDFVAYKTVDDLVSGGGDPSGGAPPPPAPEVKSPPKPAPAPEPVQPPEPQPEPVKVRQPDPVPPEIPNDKPDPDAVEPAKPVKRRVPDIVTTPTVRKRDAQKEAKAREEAAAREEAREIAARRADAAAAIGRAASGIKGGVAGGTSVVLKGPGGGGVPYANFLQAVKSVYARAWIVPDGVTDDEATAVASVTIARDGTVISARITESSGNALVDRSVRETLDKVKWAAPLPDNAVENQRTVTINFNVRARRLLG